MELNMTLIHVLTCEICDVLFHSQSVCELSLLTGDGIQVHQI